LYDVRIIIFYTMQIQRDYDEMFMQYAICLAKKGWGKTGINPLVGATVVKNNRIIGQGYHRMIGEAHAEVCALRDAGTRAQEATLYVNLEPCCCTGRTPPCVEAIYRTRIKRVVIGAIDPNPAVNGRGIKFLQNHNIDITQGILAEQANRLNAWYKKYITQKTPYVIVKIDIYQNGKLKGLSEKYITSSASLRYVHSLRSQVAAVLVGINTVLTDNPYLTDRLLGRRNPTRIVIDPHLKIPLESNFLEPDTRRIIITHQNSNKNKRKSLTDAGIEFLFLEEGHFVLTTILQKLGAFHIGSILVEGGGQVFTQFFDEQLYDELYLFVAPKTINKGIEINIDRNVLEEIQPTKIGEDLLYHVYRNN
jgi:diaminohydroxyphosphoribosylaminopyrimidine deaminase/5-amino-6-(5-phosphoribosylamino)uracil reductase